MSKKSFNMKAFFGVVASPPPQDEPNNDSNIPIEDNSITAKSTPIAP